MILAPKNAATTRTPNQFTKPRIVVTIAQAQLTAGDTKSTTTRIAILCSWRNALILFISPPFTKMNERTPVGARLSNLSATHKRKTTLDGWHSFAGTIGPQRMRYANHPPATLHQPSVLHGFPSYRHCWYTVY